MSFASPAVKLFLRISFLVAVGIAFWSLLPWLSSTSHVDDRAAQSQAPAAAPLALASPPPSSSPASNIPAVASSRKSGLVAWDSSWNQTASGPAFDAFGSWARDYLATTNTQARAAMEAEGVRRGQERRRALYELMQTDPERALQQAVPLSIRRQLPAAVEALLEDRVQGRAKFAVLGAIPLPGHEAEINPISRTATLNGVDYRAFVYGYGLDWMTQPALPLHGIALTEGQDAVLVPDQNPVRLIEDSERAALDEALAKEVICGISGNEVTAEGTPFPVEVAGQVQWLCQAIHAQDLNQQLLAAAMTPGQSGTGASSGTESGLAESPYTEGRKRLVLFRVAFPDVPTPSLAVIEGFTLITNINNYFRRVSYGQISAAMPAQGSDVILVTLTNQSSLYDGDAGRLRDDVRARATANGVDLSRYDFDITCTGGDPMFTFAGLGFVGAPGAWLANGYFGTATAVHELGHNLGYPHANFWDTGDKSAIGPGGNQEYGDPYDVMGGGGSSSGHYVVKFKWLSGWISDAEYPRITTSGRYRLHAQDALEPYGLRGVRFAHNASEDFSLEFRQLYTGSIWMMNGVGLRWGSRSGSSSQLIDTTPGSQNGKDDSPIVIGRTFSDPVGNVHITPVGKGNTVPESIDVQIHFGTAASNRSPVLTLEAEYIQAGVGTPLTFTAQATDANGDELAYFWEFDENSLGPNAPIASHSWGAVGEYVVRCTVSDMKGGTTSQSLLVTIGQSGTFRISGRVFDKGKPLADVLVAASSTRYAYTDSNGRYVIANLTAGNYTNTATLYTYQFAHPWFQIPVHVGPGSATNIDFVTIETVVDNVVLVSPNATWKYLDTGIDQGTGWRAPGFVDTTWPSGPAQLGYGDNDEATVVGYGPNPNNKYPTTYFRRAFQVPNLAAITNVNLRFLRDDGGVVYLNGTEILRDNMPTGAITYSTLAVDNSEGTTLINLPNSALVQGQNVLAAEVHQVTGSSSDLSFSIEMRATSVTNLQDQALFYIASPENNAVLTQPSTVTIKVNAFNNAGAYTSMQFFVDGVMLGTDNQAPFEMLWQNPAQGPHTLAAVATDNLGATNTAPQVRITIAPPSTLLSLVPMGASWRYLDTGGFPGLTWSQPAYNHTSWKTGNAELGYGDGGEATLVSYGPSTSSRYITTYFRHGFTVEDPSIITNLQLGVVRDDGVIVYLNGIEVFRGNMPQGPVTNSTLALAAIGGSDESQVQKTQVAPSLLNVGINIVAAEIHQSATNSSDISFNLSLDAEVSQLPSPGAKLLSPQAGATLPASPALTLTASALASPGLTITQVTFLANGAPLGRDTSFPFIFAWSQPPPGNHSLAVEAVDSAGTAMMSDSVPITIQSPALAGNLVSQGALWKYLDQGEPPAANWTATGFDDGPWHAGAARLGYGSDGEVTTVAWGTNSNNRHITTWFRHTFPGVSPGSFQALRLRVIRDDGAVVYLNGVEVFRDNLPSSSIGANTLALTALSGTDETSPVEVLLGTGLLSSGTNVIAAEIHQSAANSSDLGFDLELAGLVNTNFTEGIYLTSPAQDAQFNMPASIAIQASALAPGGIERVAFYANGNLLGDDTSPPYEFLWVNPAEGQYDLTASAFSGQGELHSPPVPVIVAPTPVPIQPVLAWLVTPGQVWKYQDEGSDLGRDWRQRPYNDASWRVGVARFGYGLDGETTTTRSNRVTTYFRKWFSVANPQQLDLLTLRLQRDDAAVVYLNGHEIHRGNMPDGNIAFGTLALATVDSLDEQTYFETVLPTSGSGLTSGTNLLAVEIHQASPTSSDMGFNLELLTQGSTDRRVYLASPGQNELVTAQSDVILEAFANAGSGSAITLVEFFGDAQKLGELTSSPYRWTWSGIPFGSHAVSVRATDTRGRAMTSPPVVFTAGFVPVAAQFIAPGSVWKYRDLGPLPDASWTQVGYNDASWLSGPARLGYGGDGEVTPVSYGPNSSSKYMTTYFRHTFTPPPNVTFTNLTLVLQRDDGAVVWINGVEVHRSNMPSTPITGTTPATMAISGLEEEQAWHTTELPFAGLQPGTSNVVAVEVHQATPDSTDLGLDLQLSGFGFVGIEPIPSLEVLTQPNNRAMIRWPQTATGWRPFVALGLGSNALWTFVNVTPGTSNGYYFITVPTFGAPRYYRLQKP